MEAKRIASSFDSTLHAMRNGYGKKLIFYGFSIFLTRRRLARRLTRDILTVVFESINDWGIVMKKALEGIWELRRDVEKRNGCAVRIYSAYPLIGRGSVIHELAPHRYVEKNFEKALHVPFWKRVVFRINRMIVHA